jgi:hypothetical protein
MEEVRVTLPLWGLASLYVFLLGTHGEHPLIRLNNTAFFTIHVIVCLLWD